MQIPDWLPVASELQYHYGQHAQLANVAVDTLAASLGILLIFFGLPALDLILGQDPGTGDVVSLHVLPSYYFTASDLLGV